jgi:hypothetical protein
MIARIAPMLVNAQNHLAAEKLSQPRSGHRRANDAGAYADGISSCPLYAGIPANQ